MRRLSPALLALALVALPAQAQIATDLTCRVNGTDAGPTVPNAHIAWPEGDPLWEFDVYRPANRTIPNGTGLELRNVYYRGRKVFERASVPMLNVEYDPGYPGCGCFRDWQWDEVRFEADGIVPGTNCFAEATPGLVRTTCDTGTGEDPGSFTGVAIEDYGTELVVTSSLRAGWYRYRMKWHVYTDGRIWPEFSFTSARSVCTQAPHRHHAYWRFDFDLDGTPTDDVVTEHAPGRPDVVFTHEADRTWGAPTDGVTWSIRDAATGIGYDVIPSEADLALPVDAYSKTDALVLRYREDEISDGGVNGSACAFEYEPWVNDEPLDGEDTVFWYRSGALHTGGAPFECDIVGPMLRPVGFVVGTAPEVAPSGVELEAAGPNPFSPTTTVRFRVAEDQPVTVALYDALGRRVRTLFAGPARAGHYETVRVEGAGLPAGTYVVRLDGPAARASTRLVLSR